MSGDEIPAVAVDKSRFLGRRYWVVRWVPAPGTTASDIELVVDAHLSWLLGVERLGQLFLSGPVLSGPQVGPGSGLTVLKVESEDEARTIAAADPFVAAGLRTFELFAWLVNEGEIHLQLSLSSGTYRWH